MRDMGGVSHSGGFFSLSPPTKEIEDKRIAAYVSCTLLIHSINTC